MTSQNVYNLAKSGQLGQNRMFENYCLSAAIDASFDTYDVPLAVYEANYAAVATGEIDNEGVATDKLFNLLGALVFKCAEQEELNATPYHFTNLEELRTDLSELRGKATILLDARNGQHAVGLKPAGDTPDQWQIVGLHQIVAVKPISEPLDIQGMSKPKTITTEQVWQYLLDHSPEAEQQVAHIFPAEPL